MEVIFIILVIYAIFKIRRWWNDDTEENNIYIEDDSEYDDDYYGIYTENLKGKVF